MGFFIKMSKFNQMFKNKKIIYVVFLQLIVLAKVLNLVTSF